MARKRMLSWEFFTSASVARLTVPARYTFAGLWVYCDDEGRGEDSPLLIKATVWPRDKGVTERVVERHLGELVTHGHICRYRRPGVSLLHVPSWFSHQKMSHPTPSRVWPCQSHEPEAVAIYSGLTPDRLRSIAGAPPEELLPNAVELNPGQSSSSGGDRCGHDRHDPKCPICRAAA